MMMKIQLNQSITCKNWPFQQYYVPLITDGKQRFDTKSYPSPVIVIMLYNIQSVRISILISSAIRNNAGWYTKDHSK